MQYEELARRAATMLPAPVWEYFSQGATDGVTAAEAAGGWDRIRLRPRVLRDVSVVTTATTVLGRPVPTPILIAPTTLQRQAHPDGELATAKAAAATGSILTVSSNAGTAFEAIGATAATWWLQCYVVRDRRLTTALLHRARDAGASAIVLTADTPVVGRKFQAGASVWDGLPVGHLQANMDLDGMAAGALDKADDLTPDTIGWLRESTGLPVVVKGVLRADDAIAAARAGAAAIQVSNHGGRQLDLSVSTAQALPAIAEALAGSDTEVYVDGGLRRAEHVLAALALGARAVFLGRPVLWALTVGGAGGVADLLTELRAELADAMKIAGAASIADLTPDLIFT